MNTEKLEEVMSILKGLASRYKNSQEYEDLIHEGLLVALEHPEEPLFDLVPKIRRAMSAYMTGFRSPVTIPDSGATRSLLSAILGDRVLTPQGHTESALLSALSALSEPIEANTLRTYESSEDLYCSEQLLERVIECMHLYLTKEEREALEGYYLQEKSRPVLAEEMGRSKDTVALRRDSGLRKLKRMLT